jgi:hypothetical protein
MLNPKAHSGSGASAFLKILVMLGLSRMMMAEAATDQKLGTMLRMH